MTGRRQWGHQVDGDTQAVKYSQGNVYFGFHEGDLGDATVRMLTADSVTGVVVAPYHLPMDSFFGVWDIDASPDAVVLGGEFTNVNGVATQGIAILPHVATETVPPTPPTNLRVSGTTATSITLAMGRGHRQRRRGRLPHPAQRRRGRVLDDHVVHRDRSPGRHRTSPTRCSRSTRPATSRRRPGRSRPEPIRPWSPLGSAWRYLDNGSNQGTAWRAGAFDDTTWASGPAQLGYGDGDEATVVSFGADPNNKPYTTYFRRQFTVANPATLSNVNLTLLRDDGAVVYLNGVEIARSNMPTGTITSTTARTCRTSTARPRASSSPSRCPARFVAGDNTLAVEIHQEYRASSDISFDLGAQHRPPARPGRAARTCGRRASPARRPRWPGTRRPGRSPATTCSATGCSSARRPAPRSRDTGLTSATSYSYTVTAINTANLESAPTAPLVVTTPDVVAPSIPTGLASPTVSATRVVARPGARRLTTSASPATTSCATAW